jgi:hypothetical protein
VPTTSSGFAVSRFAAADDHGFQREIRDEPTVEKGRLRGELGLEGRTARELPRVRSARTEAAGEGQQTHARGEQDQAGAADKARGSTGDCSIHKESIGTWQGWRRRR